MKAFPNAEYDCHKMAMGVCQVPLLPYFAVFSISITVILLYDENIMFSREGK